LKRLPKTVAKYWLELKPQSVLCIAIMAACAYIFPEPLKEESKPLIWATWFEPIRQRCGSGLSDYRLMLGLVVVIFVAFYIVFR
jgi:hypothetical protein